MPSNNYIEYSRIDDVVTIRLNQPETLNAMSLELGSALKAGIDRAATEARALIITSNGRAFCAGTNLKDGRVSKDNSNLDMGERLESIYNPMLRTLRDFPIPFITAIRGPAAGFGCSLALMGDIIIASKTAYFLQAFCRVGLVSDGGAAHLLARSIGRVKAMELMLLGEKYRAEEAYDDRLITKLVKDEDLDKTAMEYATRLAAGPTRALEIIRKSAWAALDQSFLEQIDHDRDMQKLAGRTADFLEGTAAFREKRKPNFKGD